MHRFALLLLLFSLSHAPAETRTIAGHDYPTTLEDQQGSWTLKGAGLYEYKGWIDVFTAALYEQADRKAQKLVLTYCRPIKKKVFVREANRILDEGFPASTNQQFAQARSKVNDHYRSVEKGDQYTLEFVDGERTRLYFNEQELLSIDQQGFGPYYLSVWLGERPMSASLRDALLGKDPS